MKGAVTILQAVLIFAIAVSLVAISIPWIYGAIHKSLDASEMDTVRDQMGVCNERLVETARTGTSNKCIFSANRGRVTAEWDGIYYDLITTASICDEHDWAEVDKERHLESTCDETFDIKHYILRWRWPSEVRMEGYGFTGELRKEDEDPTPVTFDPEVQFRTLTVVVEFDFVNKNPI